MENGSIQKFVRQTLKELQDALPEGFSLQPDIHFDISVEATKQSGTDLMLKIVGFNSKNVNANAHRVKFSVTNDKAAAEKAQQGRAAMMQFFATIAQFAKEHPELNEGQTMPAKRTTRKS